jgi:hypothetical protein
LKYRDLVNTVRQVIAEYPGLRLTIRQIYYRLVSPPYQIFANTPRNYKNLVAMLTKARERDDIDWRSIEDRRRGTIGGESGYSSPEAFIRIWAGDVMRNLDRYYARRRWSTQPKYVEVWVEKEALASLFEQAAGRWGVIVFPTVGYSSLTMFMEAVSRFSKIEKPIVILDFRDHDPSGLDMTRDVEDRLTSYGGKVQVKRVALTIDQVRRLNLAPNPTKKADTRTPRYLQQYGDQCWELDAYPPNLLSQLVAESIQSEVDLKLWEEVETLETEDKKRIKTACEQAGGLIDELEQTLLNRVA